MASLLFAAAEFLLAVSLMLGNDTLPAALAEGVIAIRLIRIVRIDRSAVFVLKVIAYLLIFVVITIIGQARENANVYLSFSKDNLYDGSRERAVGYPRISGMLNVAADVQHVHAAARQGLGISIIDAAVPSNFQRGF